MSCRVVSKSNLYIIMKNVNVISKVSNEWKAYVIETHLSPSAHMKYFRDTEQGQKALVLLVKHCNAKYGTTYTPEKVIGKGSPKTILSYMSEKRLNKKDGTRRVKMSMYWFGQAIEKMIRESAPKKKTTKKK